MFARGAACCSVRDQPDTAKPQGQEHRAAHGGCQQHREEVTRELGAEQEHRDPRQYDGLNHDDHQSGEHLGDQQGGRIERGSQESAQHSLAFHAHEAERHAEHAQLHDGHADDPGHEEVDVTQVAGIHRLAFNRDDSLGFGDREVHFVNCRPKDVEPDLRFVGPAGVIEGLHRGCLSLAPKILRQDNHQIPVPLR